MKVRWPHPSRIGRVRAGLDRLEPKPTLSIGGLNGEALEVGIQRRRVRITRVGVPPVRVGLPELDPRPFHRLSLDAQDAAHDIYHLARGPPWLAGQYREIRTLIDCSENRVEGTENLAWRPFERLGERGGWRTGESEASCCDGHSQNLASRKCFNVGHVGASSTVVAKSVPAIRTD